MENYAISARYMTGWDQARKEYFSPAVPDPSNPGHYMKLFKPQRVQDFQMTGSPELILKKELSDGNLQTETDIDSLATKITVDPSLCSI